MYTETTVRHKGAVAWFFVALIPGAIAGAALMWLAFYTGVIDWQKTQRVEGRMDARVGVNGAIKAPVDLVIRKTGCLQVSRAFLDDDGSDQGTKLTIYVSNSCNRDFGLVDWTVHWNAVAPDATIISGKADVQDGEIGAGQTEELTERVPQDNRITKIVTWSTVRQ